MDPTIASPRGPTVEELEDEWEAIQAAAPVLVLPQAHAASSNDGQALPVGGPWDPRGDEELVAMVSGYSRLIGRAQLRLNALKSHLERLQLALGRRGNTRDQNRRLRKQMTLVRGEIESAEKGLKYLTETYDKLRGDLESRGDAPELVAGAFHDGPLGDASCREATDDEDEDDVLAETTTIGGKIVQALEAKWHELLSIVSDREPGRDGKGVLMVAASPGPRNPGKERFPNAPNPVYKQRQATILGILQDLEDFRNAVQRSLDYGRGLTNRHRDRLERVLRETDREIDRYERALVGIEESIGPGTDPIPAASGVDDGPLDTVRRSTTAALPAGAAMTREDLLLVLADAQKDADIGKFEAKQLVRRRNELRRNRKANAKFWRQAKRRGLATRTYADNDSQLLARIKKLDAEIKLQRAKANKGARHARMAKLRLAKMRRTGRTVGASVLDLGHEDLDSGVRLRRRRKRERNPEKRRIQKRIKQLEREIKSVKRTFAAMDPVFVRSTEREIQGEIQQLRRQLAAIGDALPAAASLSTLSGTVDDDDEEEEDKAGDYFLDAEVGLRERMQRLQAKRQESLARTRAKKELRKGRKARQADLKRREKALRQQERRLRAERLELRRQRRGAYRRQTVSGLGWEHYQQEAATIKREIASIEEDRVLGAENYQRLIREALSDGRLADAAKLQRQAATHDATLDQTLITLRARLDKIEPEYSPAASTIHPLGVADPPNLEKSAHHFARQLVEAADALGHPFAAGSSAGAADRHADLATQHLEDLMMPAEAHEEREEKLSDLLADWVHGWINAARPRKGPTASPDLKDLQMGWGDSREVLEMRGERVADHLALAFIDDDDDEEDGDEEGIPKRQEHDVKVGLAWHDLQEAALRLLGKTTERHRWEAQSNPKLAKEQGVGPSGRWTIGARPSAVQERRRQSVLDADDAERLMGEASHQLALAIGARGARFWGWRRRRAMTPLEREVAEKKLLAQELRDLFVSLSGRDPRDRVRYKGRAMTVGRARTEIQQDLEKLGREIASDRRVLEHRGSAYRRILGAVPEEAMRADDENLYAQGWWSKLKKKAYKGGIWVAKASDSREIIEQELKEVKKQLKKIKPFLWKPWGTQMAQDPTRRYEDEERALKQRRKTLKRWLKNK